MTPQRAQALEAELRRLAHDMTVQARHSFYSEQTRTLYDTNRGQVSGLLYAADLVRDAAEGE